MSLQLFISLSNVMIIIMIMILMRRRRRRRSYEINNYINTNTKAINGSHKKRDDIHKPFRF